MLEAAVVHVADRRTRRTLVDGVSLSVAEGDLVVLLGETGAGAHEFLRVLTGRLRRRDQVRGSLIVDGRELVHEGRVVRGAADDLDLLRTGWTPDLAERITHRLAGPGLVVVPDVFGRCTDEQVVAFADAVSGHRVAGLIVATSDPRIAFAVADRIIVMYAGCPVESGPAYRLLAEPAHPYTRALVDAVATVEGPAPTPVPGTAPTASAAALQCVFADRCEHTRLTCWWDRPLPRPVAFGHSTACARHRHIELSRRPTPWVTGGPAGGDEGGSAGEVAGSIVGLHTTAMPPVNRSVHVVSGDVLSRERRCAGDVVVDAIGGSSKRPAWTADECREDVMAVLASVGLPRRVAAQRCRDLPPSQRIAVAVALAIITRPGFAVIDSDAVDVTARPAVWGGARTLAAAGCEVTIVSSRRADLLAAADTIDGLPAAAVADRLRQLPADRVGAVAVGVTLAPPSLLDM